MEKKKLRTIEEENKRRASPSVKIEPQYKGTGIASPFGGEILEEVALGRYGGEIHIKCSETGRRGTMQTNNTPGGSIEEVLWDEFYQPLKDNGAN